MRCRTPLPIWVCRCRVSDAAFAQVAQGIHRPFIHACLGRALMPVEVAHPAFHLLQHFQRLAVPSLLDQQRCIAATRFLAGQARDDILVEPERLILAPEMIERPRAQHGHAIALVLRARIADRIEQGKRLRALPGLEQRTGELSLRPRIDVTCGAGDRLAIDRDGFVMPAQSRQRIGQPHAVRGGVRQIQRIASRSHLAFGIDRRDHVRFRRANMPVALHARQHFDEEIGDRTYHRQENQRGEPHLVPPGLHQMDDARHLQRDDREIDRHWITRSDPWRSRFRSTGR